MNLALSELKNKKSLAIIQLTRIGDLIQTFLAAKELNKQYPEVALTLIARKKFAKPLAFLLDEVFDNIIYLDTKDFFAYEGEKSLKQTMNACRSLLKSINDVGIDVVVNLSFCKPSTYLTSLVNTSLKIGCYRSTNAQIIVNDTWSQLVFSNIMKTAFTPYNLVDIYKRILGVSRTEIPQVTNDLSTRSNSIVIHPFASEKRKRWGHSKWLEVIYQILKHNSDYKITLVGGKEDESELHFFKDSQILKGFSDRLDYFVGTKSIEEVYRTLTDAKLFIGHDSMVGHLAAVAQTPSLTLSLGTVRPYETTPYQVGALNIAPRIKCYPCHNTTPCELMPCHSDLSYQSVVAITNTILAGGDVQELLKSDKARDLSIDNVNVFKTYEPDTRELELEEISKQQTDSMMLFQSFYKILWSFTLSGLEISSSVPKLSDTVKKTLNFYLEGVTHLFELYKFGTNFSKFLLDETKAKTPQIPKLQEYNTKINEIIQMTSIIKNHYPFLAPIVNYYHVKLSNVPGDSIITVAENTLIGFNQGNQACSIFYELISQCVAQNSTASTTPSRTV
ncbi:MAG: glycosyltransferase family 9 protein [Bacteriovoracaceae bacterium]|nr:glycosyltransferase family 9 protein [Bacteriovoracaceae bacterium]